MNLMELSGSNYREIMESDGIVLIDCRDPWNAHGGQFPPVYRRVADLYPQHTFARLDTRMEGVLAQVLGVKKTPTLLVMRRGLLVCAQSGEYSEPALIGLVEKTGALDMKAILKKLNRGCAAEAASPNATAPCGIH